MSPASASMSLPSIHEMFPDHLMRMETKRPRSYQTLPGGTTLADAGPALCRDPGWTPSSSAMGRSKTSRPHRPCSAFSSSPLTKSDQPAKSRSNDEQSSPFSYDLLRSDPTTGHLKHVASSGHSPLFRRNPRQNPASDPIPPHTHHDHKDIPTSRHPTNYSYPTYSPVDGYCQDRPKPGLYSPDTAYRPRSLSFSDVDRTQYPYPPDKPYLPHYGFSSGHSEEDDGEMDDYNEGKTIAIDDGVGINNLDALGRKHVCPTCLKRFNRPSSLRIHLNTHTGATPFKCPWPNCGREFNVNSNMRRHYRNHISPARSQGMSNHAAPPSTSHLQVDPSDVPALVHATVPHRLGPHSNHDVLSSLHRPPFLLISNPEGQNSVDHRPPSPRGMYHANHHLERKQERRRRSTSPEGPDPYHRGDTIQHHHQKPFMVSGKDDSAMDLDHMGSNYSSIPSPPTSQSSLSDSGLRMIQPRRPSLTYGVPPKLNSSRPCPRSQHHQPVPVAATSIHHKDEFGGDQMNGHRRHSSHLGRSHYEQPDYSPSNSPLTLSRTSSPEERVRHLSESSRPKYNASKPYVESLKDSRVSTTLRPAFK